MLELHKRDFVYIIRSYILCDQGRVLYGVDFEMDGIQVIIK